MRRFAIRLSALVLVASLASQASAEDKFVGAIWQMKVKTPKGEWVDAVKFRADDAGKLFFEGEKIGTYKLENADWWAGKLTRASDNAEVPIRLGRIKD